MKNGKIDVHAHVFPPTWRAECRERGQYFPEWTAEGHLRLMDTLGIQKSILSVTAPGTHLDPNDGALARRLAREANVFMAQLAKENPERFGFFAALPLPDCDGAIEEAEFAIRELKADGIGLMTNSHGIYLGDPKFEPVFQKLNSLETKVFLHPTPCRHQPTDNGYCSVSEPVPAIPGSVLEYLFDTTRAVTNLLISGTVTRYPNITYIAPHCGALIPASLERSTEFARRAIHLPRAMTSAEARSALRSRFYFDLAGFVCAEQLPAILRIIRSDRLLFGSDLPFTPIDVAKELVDELDKELVRHCGHDALQQIYEENASSLFMA